jgi:leader peptidase (prepilin peptidase) / N-methyltransferase
MPVDLFFISFFFIIGLIVGSFLNVLIFRIYYKKPFAKGRSYCPKCKKQIPWHDNIPVISFLMLKGKCSKCNKKISWQYPLVEFFTGLLFVVVAIKNLELTSGCVGFCDQNLALNLKFLTIFFRDLFIISILVIVFVQDFNWYIILDKVILPATAVVFLLNIILGHDFLNLILGSFIAGGFFYLQFIISNGKWIGGGDIRLGLFMGVSLGFPLVLVALFLAYILGSIIGIFLILIGKKGMGSKLPFGTFLTPATLVALFWGQSILSWYISFVNYGL